MNLPRVSASRLTTYRKCARYYQLEYLTGQREDKPTSYAILGSALHKAIERYYVGESALNVFQDTFNELSENPDIQHGYAMPRLFEEGVKIIRNLDLTKFDPSMLEFRFDLPFPNAQNPICTISGIIDMIHTNSETGGYDIIDHKSKSGKAPGELELAHNPQFLIYYWAGTQLFETKPENVYWHHLRSGRLYRANVDIDYEDKLLQLYNDIEALIGAKYYARKEMDSFCRTQCLFSKVCYPRTGLEEEKGNEH